MELSQQVISLEYAQRLKELGVKKESLFIWFHCKSPEEKWVLCNNNLKPFLAGKDCNKDQAAQVVSAFTNSELGAILPKEINGYFLTQIPTACLKRWVIFYRNSLSSMKNDNRIIEFTDKNEANCRAKMLIHLLENGLLENGLNNE